MKLRSYYVNLGTQRGAKVTKKRKVGASSIFDDSDDEDDQQVEALRKCGLLRSNLVSTVEGDTHKGPQRPRGEEKCPVDFFSTDFLYIRYYVKYLQSRNGNL